MEYSKFKQFLKDGEKANLDFKLTCNAFLSKRITPKGELAKDICAMANNGNIASYIVIGVSDDRKSFQSVNNSKLTEGNLQAFCKTAIYPPPKIKVYKKHWAKTGPSRSGKEFVIIQIGPQARKAFRLARDFISYSEKIAYHRNEVWIRRGTTSDIATPEEVARLVQGKPPIEHKKIENNIIYARLPLNKQLKAMANDFALCVKEKNDYIYKNRVVIRLGRVRYVLRLILLDEFTEKFSNWNYIYRNWEFEHGVLFLVKGTVSKQIFRPDAKINFKEKWGWFTSYESSSPWDIFPRLLRQPNGPVNKRLFPLVSFTLPKLSDTEALRNSFFSLLSFLETGQDVAKEIRRAHNEVNYNLRMWVKQGWLIERGPSYLGRRPKKSELTRKPVGKMAQTILNLSAGRLP